ncbi:MAG: hypothetical protein ACREUQ_04395, partial [Burkholderiales bacterium]
MNKRCWLTFISIGLVALVQGCSLRTQNLHLDPPLRTSGPSVGNSALIGLSVKDARADKKLGEVGDPNTKMVDVRLDEDFGPTLYNRLSN